MIDQNTFMETVKSVSEIMKVAETPMSKEDILSYFKDMELSKEQEDIVLEYLLTPHEEDAEGEGAQEEAKPELNEQQSQVFKLYLEELEGLPKYTHTEEIEMYNALLQGDESAIGKLSDCWLSKVLESAKGYLTPKLNIEDLVQEGNMALFVALQQLCGSGKCDDVEAVLRSAVEEGIMKYVSEINGEKEAEEAMLAKVSLVHAAKKLLKEEIGQDPTIEQLADYTKMSVEELTDVFELLEETKEN